MPYLLMEAVYAKERPLASRGLDSREFTESASVNREKKVRRLIGFCPETPYAGPVRQKQAPRRRGASIRNEMIL